MSLQISNTLKSRLFKVLWITVAWTFIAVSYVLTIYFSMVSFGDEIQDVDILLHLRGILITGIISGIIGGGLVVFFWEKWLRTKTYGSSLWSIFWSYTLINFLVELPGALYVGSTDLGLPFYHREVWFFVWNTIASIPWLLSYLFWLLVVVGTLIVLLVNDKYGPGVFRDFLCWAGIFTPKGKSASLCSFDLRSATTIAEKLGEQRYFEFLKDIIQQVYHRAFSPPKGRSTST